ncbi:hypothetical protein [Actinoplanes subtropicus]|uniref:hypothetical protein n=1 Tax=Actinoplanes subtropicus TaxID=543632 RepID=UPI00068C9AF5|nr:hypothetical protein [Actinoplanes subtropicus]
MNRDDVARVLLVDYPSVFGDRTAPGPGVPFEPGEIAALRDIRSALEAAYVAAAERSGAELVAISGVRRDHALGSAEPWVAPFIEDPMAFGGSFHSNAAGMAAVAAYLEKLIR